MKTLKKTTALLLVMCLVLAAAPALAGTHEQTDRGVHSGIVIDDNASGGYEGDYVVIYNPATSSSTSYSTGTMTGLIETTVEPNVVPARSADGDKPLYKIDVDSKVAELAKTVKPEPIEDTRASYNVGDTKTFRILQQYSPTGSSSMQFECLCVGQHCYIWTPTSSSNNTYPLDEIDSSFAQMAADEFDSKFDLMQSSFGNHTNGSSGDGKLHMLYYNINEGWNGSGGYVAGFFYQVDLTNNGVPILNIDTYPGVYYQNPNSGNIYKRMDDTYGTMVHEYQHLINYSNTSGMATWLNECFSAAAEEICYPGSSVVGRIQSWEDYYYSDNGDWLDPPKEFAYNSDFNLHKGFSLYNWDNDIDDILALYSQVSFFAQYLFTRFGNTIYRQISNKYSSSETSAITSATGVSCADLARDFRVAVTANAAQSDYNGVYGFVPQEGYDPAAYNNVQNPYDLLSPVVFTGTSCSIKGGGAITVKPVNGVYNPPSGASSSLKYIGITVKSYNITAVSNNASWGTVSVSGSTITAVPAEGYYVESAEVTEGTATVTVNGNTISVNASSDCTVRVNFAPKPQYTVSFIACGASVGSQTALVNDVITLPSTCSVTAEGWEFSGWVDHQVAETTDEPVYFAPGASYTVTGNATLYALYTRVDGDAGSETVYRLITSAPASWEGNYVITNNPTSLNTSGMYVLKSIAGGSNGTNIENSDNCSIFANTGITIEDNVMHGVADNYVMTIEANGSYYTVKNAAGAYYGMTSSSYLAAYSAYNASYCRWTPAINTSGAVQLKNVANGSYPYFGFSVNYNYFWSASTSNAYVLRLWKEDQVTASVTYYNTDPVVQQDTYYTVTFKDWNGTVLSVQQVLEGEAAEAPADPVREGYTFIEWDEDFTHVTSDVITTAVYEANPYTLTIDYLDENGEAISAPYTATVHTDEAYSVESPVIPGYTPDIEVVSGVMGPCDESFKVTYTRSGLIGDVDVDGDVDFDDVTLLSYYLLDYSSAVITEQGMINADANLDGLVDVLDLAAICNIAMSR
ncbi:MAG: InlB B-repeat-containing protein [Clostridia bacterium]|nr:InlB B-repeat-containing protein [Clostridia bacterium]